MFVADAEHLAAEKHDLMARRLETRLVEGDEPWSPIGRKEQTGKPRACGHVYAWARIALEADSKLIVSYGVGRDSANATVSERCS